MGNKRKTITKTVWLLSLVSLFTDAASEMLYPVMPLYLKSIGFSVFFIGVLEGLAEAVAGLSKAYFGYQSDHIGKRVPFVQAGYGLSALSRPLMAAFTFPLWVFVARTLDRLGKGIRTGARDALLSDEADSDSKGKVFGFHRAMDTLGAVIGPLIALAYLHFFPESYRMLFLLAVIPGLAAFGLAGLLREGRHGAAGNKPKPSLFAFLKYWGSSQKSYRQVAAALLCFALFNGSDVFLLLRAKECGFSDSGLIWLYVGYNLTYAVAAYPLGSLADRIGLRQMVVVGLFVFGSVYAGMAYFSTQVAVLSLFLLYGVYAAATEGVAKAWLSELAPKTETATAIGTYSAFQSLAAFAASSFTGLIWMQFGAATALLLSAVAALGVGGYLMALKKG